MLSSSEQMLPSSFLSVSKTLEENISLNIWNKRSLQLQTWLWIPVPCSRISKLSLRIVRLSSGPEQTLFPSGKELSYGPGNEKKSGIEYHIGLEWVEKRERNFDNWPGRPGSSGNRDLVPAELWPRSSGWSNADNTAWTDHQVVLV